jgi:hypothetical protein
MTRTRMWTVSRQPSPRRDAQRRWDQAYQLLVRLGAPGRSGLPDADRRGGA